MASYLRRDSEGVASTVATIFTIIIALLFFQIAVLDAIPRRQYDAEWATSQEAAESFRLLRATLAGPVVPGSTFSVPLQLGTWPVSPMGSGSPGYLTFESAEPGPTFSFRLVPNVQEGQVTTVDQDIILLMDSSGSMQWNDPSNIRIEGAKEYVGRLRHPDRVAIVDFDHRARFTRENVGGEAHHFNSRGHDGLPSYADPQADLDTIDSDGATHFGDAIRIANDEFLTLGDTSHAWVMILLTDGENCCGRDGALQDAMARSEAQRAKANGIAIYTIGLGPGADEPLLSEIAATTGGTYYAAPTAESLRWIYYEISRSYQGTFTCGLLSILDRPTGSLSLTLASREYPRQTLSLESGGIALAQSDGVVVLEGLPLVWTPSGLGSGDLSLTVVTFTGRDSSASGLQYEVAQARLEARDVVDQPIRKVALGGEAGSIGNLSADMQFWADEGAATQSASAAIRAPLEQARLDVLAADANVTEGNITQAKFDMDSAQAQLSAAIDEVDDQESLGQIQGWLASSMKDNILVAACRLDQWQNWYDGITITIDAASAAGWAGWFNETLSRSEMLFSIGLSGDRAVISIHAVDRFVFDHRIFRLSFSD